MRFSEQVKYWKRRRTFFLQLKPIILETSETIEKMIANTKDRAVEEEDKAKKYIEELMKNKLNSAEGQVKSSERKYLKK